MINYFFHWSKHLNNNSNNNDNNNNNNNENVNEHENENENEWKDFLFEINHSHNFYAQKVIKIFQILHFHISIPSTSLRSLFCRTTSIDLFMLDNIFNGGIIFSCMPVPYFLFSNIILCQSKYFKSTKLL